MATRQSHPLRIDQLLQHIQEQGSVTSSSYDSRQSVTYNQCHHAREKDVTSECVPKLFESSHCRILPESNRLFTLFVIGGVLGVPLGGFEV